jgi:hypothetical protein
LNFRIEEIDGVPQAVFEDTGQPGTVLLKHFLHPAPHFVPDVLYEISLVERRAVESSGFETDFVDVQFFPDRVLIKPRIMNADEGESLGILLSVNEAKLLLLEWGAKVQRWRIENKKTG